MVPPGIDRSWSNRAVLAVVVVAALGGVARAHQASTTYSFVEVSDDRRSADYRILFSPPDLAEVVGIPPDRAPSDERIDRRAGDILAHTLARVSIENDDRACPVEPGGVEIVDEDGRFVEVTWRAVCPRPFDPLVIEYDLFFALDPLHTAYVRVEVPGEETATAQLRDGEARFVWDLREPPPSDLGGFVVSGIEHILFGFDHICFLLALLLVIAIEYRQGTWRLRGLRSGLRYTGLVVTSFTVAHSITLIAASLGWVTLPGRLVESLIAASIVYIALEDILRPHASHRYAVTFGFGLVHGLGFASMLQVALPPEGIVAPLLMFNVGVELGQLAFVVVVLPLLSLAARLVGGPEYRRWLMPALATVLAAAGIVWLVERVLDVTLLGI